MAFLDELNNALLGTVSTNIGVIMSGLGVYFGSHTRSLKIRQKFRCLELCP